MKTKLELAHEYAMQHTDEQNPKLSVERAWQYADAMYAELEKRKDTSRPDVLNDFDVDWSQAPDDALTWAISPLGIASWALYKDGVPYGSTHAPSFNYTGNWRDSLRKRP